MLCRVMPRVVENQKAKFQSDALLKQMQVHSEIKYTNYCDCSLEQRRLRFRAECYTGNCKIPCSPYTTPEFVDFERERGKVHLTCSLIFNGVCVKFYGCLSIEELVGFGHLEFDEEQAQVEDHLMKETLAKKSLKEQAEQGEASFPMNRNSCIYESYGTKPK